MEEIAFSLLNLVRGLFLGKPKEFKTNGAYMLINKAATSEVVQYYCKIDLRRMKIVIIFIDQTIRARMGDVGRK